MVIRAKKIIIEKGLRTSEKAGKGMPSGPGELISSDYLTKALNILYLDHKLIFNLSIYFKSYL